MNRRTFINWTWLASIAALLFGFKSFGTASAKACAIAHNGIISPKRTPWAIGCKVYVNGKLIPNVAMVNTHKGYVLAHDELQRGTLGYHQTHRIYGWIEIDDSDCISSPKHGGKGIGSTTPCITEEQLARRHRTASDLRTVRGDA
jgi:hypothetical protein